MHLFTGEGAAHSYQIPSRPPGGEGQGWEGPFSLDIIIPRTRTIPLSWDSCCTLCHHCMTWVGAWVSGVGGEAGLAGALGPPVPSEQGDSPPWSLLLC